MRPDDSRVRPEDQQIGPSKSLLQIEHELRNALSIVVAYLMLAQRRLVEQEIPESEVTIALRAAQRCVDALNNLSEE